MISFVVSEQAIDSFKNEWELEENQYVRIYAKYVGGGSDAFTIGINASATPVDPALVQSIGGFHFFVEKTDAWILQDELLQIDSNENGIFSSKISY
ncbi:Fe-S cluster assembly protein HesB [Paenibacillus amylolyticus]|uniref:Fe-S cluster assembly protein HesB n=1 Tax=Paenibacillus amylolyticus TaxID=1451 RepID=UPI0032427913